MTMKKNNTQAVADNTQAVADNTQAVADNTQAVVVVTNKMTTERFYNIQSLSDATDLFNALDVADVNIEKARAWILYEVVQRELLKSTKYKGIGAFAKDKFGFSKGNTSMYVKGATFLVSPVRSVFASPSGRDFSITQLSVLADVDADTVWSLLREGQLSYNTTVRDIKKLLHPEKTTADETTADETTADNEKKSVSVEPYFYVETIVNGKRTADETFKINVVYEYNDVIEAVKGLVNAWNVGNNKCLLFTYDLNTDETKVHHFTHNNNNK